MTNCLGFWPRKRSRREVLKALKNFSLFPVFFSVSLLGTDNSKFFGQVQTKVASGTRQHLENFAIKTFGITTKGGEEEEGYKAFGNCTDCSAQIYIFVTPAIIITVAHFVYPTD